MEEQHSFLVCEPAPRGVRSGDKSLEKQSSSRGDQFNQLNRILPDLLADFLADNRWVGLPRLSADVRGSQRIPRQKATPRDRER